MTYSKVTNLNILRSSGKTGTYVYEVVKFNRIIICTKQCYSLEAKVPITTKFVKNTYVSFLPVSFSHSFTNHFSWWSGDLALRYKINSDRHFVIFTNGYNFDITTNSYIGIMTKFSNFFKVHSVMGRNLEINSAHL